MDGVVETVRSSIRILRRNKATVSADEVEDDMHQDPQKAQEEEKLETCTALTSCQTIHIPP